MAASQENIRTYQYRCAMPVEGLTIAFTQQRLRVAYWNALATHVRRARRSLSRSPRAKTPDPPLAPQSAGFDLKTVRAQFRAQGLYHGNYQDVERAFRAVLRRVGPPHPRRYDPWSGTVSYWFMKGLPVSQLSCDPRVRLEPVPPWSSRAGVRHTVRTRLLRIRVGTDHTRQPIWLALPIFLHRPLPTDGIIRLVRVQWRPSPRIHLPTPEMVERFQRALGLDNAEIAAALRAVGLDWTIPEQLAPWVRRQLEWSASFVVALPSRPTQPRPACRYAAMALCWRMVANRGLRCGYWLGDDGAEGDVVLPHAWLADIAQADRLRSLRARRRNELVRSLLEWGQSASSCPSWLRHALNALPSWRSPTLFACLAWFWQCHRFTDDEQGFALLWTWRADDRRLALQEWSRRATYWRRRREAYRRIAAQLSRRYQVILLEKQDLRPLATANVPGAVPSPEQHQRMLAAPSLLRALLADAFLRDHGPGAVVLVPPATLQLCPTCGTVLNANRGASPIFVCPACGTAEDHDRRVCLHLFAQVHDTLAQQRGDQPATTTQ